jgi:hypothetical protein
MIFAETGIALDSPVTETIEKASFIRSDDEFFLISVGSPVICKKYGVPLYVKKSSSLEYI